MPERLTTDVITDEIASTITHPKTKEEYEVIYKDLKEEEKQKLANLEEKAREGDEEAATELQERVIEDYVVDPEVSIEDLGAGWKQTLMVGFFTALGDNEAVEQANELMDTVNAQGNP